MATFNVRDAAQIGIKHPNYLRGGNPATGPVIETWGVGLLSADDVSRNIAYRIAAAVNAKQPPPTFTGASLLGTLKTDIVWFYREFLTSANLDAASLARGEQIGRGLIPDLYPPPAKTPPPKSGKTAKSGK